MRFSIIFFIFILSMTFVYSQQITGYVVLGNDQPNMQLRSYASTNKIDVFVLVKDKNGIDDILQNGFLKAEINHNKIIDIDFEQKDDVLGLYKFSIYEEGVLTLELSDGKDLINADYKLKFAEQGFTGNFIFNTGWAVDDLDVVGTFEVANTAPMLINNLPNQTWTQGESKNSAFDLDDYFTDINNQSIDYYASTADNPNVNVIIGDDNIVDFSAGDDFYGVEYVVFYANDTINLTPSNTVMLTVVQKEAEISTVTAGGSCYYNWTCSNWGECQIDNKQYRQCINNGTCPDSWLPLDTTRNCTYIPRCDDGVRNGDEAGVDCGGSCDGCPMLNISEMEYLGLDVLASPSEKKPYLIMIAFFALFSLTGMFFFMLFRKRF